MYSCFFIRNRMTADECLEDKWLQTSETMLKFRTEAVFPTVELRNYVTESFLESLKVSEVQLLRLREKFLIAQEAKVEQTLPKAKVRLESFKCNCSVFLITKKIIHVFSSFEVS